MNCKSIWLSWAPILAFLAQKNFSALERIYSTWQCDLYTICLLFIVWVSMAIGKRSASSVVCGNRFLLMILTPMEPLYYSPVLFFLGGCVSYAVCDVERRILWIPGFVCSWQALLHFPPLCAHLPWWCSLPWISNPLCPSLWTAALLLDSSQILTQ